MNENIVIVATARTAVGPFGGSLGPLTVPAPGATALRTHLIDSRQGRMSRSAHFQARSRAGRRMGDWPLVDTTIVGGFRYAFNQFHSSVTNENLARPCGFNREALTTFAATPQQQA